MTGWLVSWLTGFKIEAMALPLLAAGVGFKLISRNPKTRFGGGAGGLCAVFPGVVDPQNCIGSSALGFQNGNLISADYGLPAYMLIGLWPRFRPVSSAALAIVLTAAAGGLVPPIMLLRQ